MSEYDYIVYTDGACIGNPGPGGWAVIIRDAKGNEQVLQGSARRTTNNRMELRAALEALRTLPAEKHYRILMRADSRLLVDALTKGWAKRWRDHGWRRSSRERVENVDLWAPLLEELEQRNVTVEWVKSHDTDLLNERCDKLAYAQALHPTEDDPGYRDTPRHEQTTTALPLDTSALHCHRIADDRIAISDGNATVVVPKQSIPELLSALAKLLIE
ncbi:MAG: ribonuclease H [Bacteroidota bacterium]|nr:ribonuclease HI [Candidatus Kapabacteria bacterium]MCX7936791.1 ribonuclease HI [Chlorobiota bacterium]MDW8074165.1 ribonuclease H [Bacteroidota bacterium]MDW8271359.1 ribonuclease H [Bacteroidota bacterium]